MSPTACISPRLAAHSGVLPLKWRPALRVLWLPAKHWFAGSAHFVKPGHTRGVWRFQYELGAFFHFLGDVLHRVNEKIELFFRFALRGLNHERAVHDQRKGHGVRMEAVINQAL